MNNTTINTFIRYAIITGLGVIAFIPLYVENQLFFPFITGKGFALRIIVEIIFALWLILILRERGTSTAHSEKSILPHWNAMTILVTFFTLVALAADLSGLSPLRSLWSNFERMEGWIIIVHLWAYFLVLSSVIKTKQNWQRFFNVVLIAGGIVALYGLFQFFGWANTHQGNRVDASLGNSAYMAIYMLINACIAVYFAIVNFSEKHLLWSYSILAALFSFVMFQTATRGTILGWIAAILISCALYAIFGRKKTGQSNLSRMITGGVIIFVILVGGLFWANRKADWIQKNEVLGRIASISINDTKTQARGFIWPMAIKGVFESPKTAIIGVGQENFNYIFNSHYDPKMWRHEQWFDRAHSVYLDWLVAGGLLGFISYLALYIIALVYIYKSNLTVGQKSILVGLLVGYGIHNVFVFDNQTSYVMFFTFLAYLSALLPGKIYPWFKNYSKHVSEDSITVRDYIFVPIIVIALGISFYCFDVRLLQANKNLLKGLQTCSNTQTVSITPFKKALALNQTAANQETREQFLSCATNVIQSQQTSENVKVDFFELAKKEIDAQIKISPNDARIYIIGGSFFDSIHDYANATPLLEKANMLSPNKQSILYELGANYFNIKKVTEAIAVMEKAYLLAPENPTARTAYAAALITNNEDDKAVKIFGDDPKIFNDPKIVNAYMYTKQYARAIEIYKTMIVETPDNPDLYSALAGAYFQNKQTAKSVETLRAAGVKFPVLKTQIDDVIKQIEEGKIKL